MGIFIDDTGVPQQSRILTWVALILLNLITSPEQFGLGALNVIFGFLLHMNLPKI